MSESLISGGPITDAASGGTRAIEDDIRAFVLKALSDMNYDTTGVDDETLLGPAGADLESLALAELLVRVEEAFGVQFDDEEAEQLAVMTVGEFRSTVAGRLARTGSETAPSAVL